MGFYLASLLTSSYCPQVSLHLPSSSLSVVTFYSIFHYLKHLIGEKPPEDFNILPQALHKLSLLHTATTWSHDEIKPRLMKHSRTCKWSLHSHKPLIFLSILPFYDNMSNSLLDVVIVILLLGFDAAVIVWKAIVILITPSWKLW